MASIRLSLRAAVLFAILAVGEVSAIHHDNGAAPKRLPRRGRCRHNKPSSVLSETLVPSAIASLTLSSSTISSSTIPSSTLGEVQVSSASSTESSSSESLPTSSPSSSTFASSTLTASYSFESLPASSSALSTSVSIALSISSSVESDPTFSSSLSTLSTLTSITRVLSIPTPQPSSASPSSSSSWSLPSSTSVVPSSSTALSLSASTPSSSLVSSTISLCEPTISTWAPELCWRSVPARCNSITISTAASATLAAHFTTCSSALVDYSTQLAPGVSSCFQSMGNPQIDYTSAWSCIASAPIYCSSTTVCAPTTTPTSPPIIPEQDPSFEKAGTSSGDWTQITAPTTPNNIVFSFSTEQAHTGSYSLKIVSNNVNADTTSLGHRVKFEPGKPYEFSLWYYAMANQQPGTLGLKASWPGSGTTLIMGPQNMPVGRWTQQRFTLTPPTSFGTVSIVYTSTSRTASNVIYIDDVTVTKIG